MTTPLAAIIVAFLIGGVILGFYTVGLAIIGERVGANDLAAANAAFLVMYQAGAIVGPIVAGIAMTTSPVTGFCRDGRDANGRIRDRPVGARRGRAAPYQV